MTRTALSLTFAAAALAGCATPQTVERVVYVERAPVVLVETSAVPAPPRDDIPESQRLQWFAARQPQARYVPEQVVEREVVSVPWYERCGWWNLPISLSLGYMGGGGHHGDGWGVGLNWNSGWWGW